MTTERPMDEAFRKVAALSAVYDSGADFYRSPRYQESEVRNDFINKFFAALGWDVTHDIQTNPFEQEVKVEKNEGKSQRRADYAFHLAPNFRDPIFIVEAKKPSGDIATADNYFQTIRYGWSNDNAIACITDFEHLHFLDCRYVPDVNTALQRCVRKYHISDLADPDKFAEVYWLISREAVASDSLSKFAATIPKGRRISRQQRLFTVPDQSVDESFLKDLDAFRERLAKSFHAARPDLDADVLTEATQRTLDRLVFMRFLEDKLIEPSKIVATFSKNDSAWDAFRAASRRLDKAYNGIVFKAHRLVDAPDFAIDDAVFADITSSLSDDYSKYAFNLIPIHILGSIYERFLGNVVVIKGKKVSIEPKPEVRKAGGVYYTPEYIVRYIVASTIGKLIEGKRPEDIAQMRFADISCGSGSFLIEVYDLLIRYHTRYYGENPKRAKKGAIVVKDGIPHLSIDIKRDILLNNIFGVDIDHQAVEVTQLSLYLKMLDDETIASTHNYQFRFKLAILPSLADNIVCGNSLIGNGILGNTLFATDTESRFNPLSYEDTFPKIMASGGFDAIVGNPPWGADFSKEELAYLRKTQSEVIARMVDSYIYFINQAIRVSKKTAPIGLIVPSTILNQVDAAPIRKILVHRGMSALFSMGQGIFGPKVLNTSTVFVTAKAPKVFTVKDLSKVEHDQKRANLSDLANTEWTPWKKMVERDSHHTFAVGSSDHFQLLDRLRQRCPALETVIHGTIQRGVSPDIVAAHVVPIALAKTLHLEASLLRPSVSGKQIKRYQPFVSDQWIIYTDRKTRLRDYPNIADFMRPYRRDNTCPEVAAGKHPWYALHRPRDPDIFLSPKFIGLTTSKTIELAYDEVGNLCVTDAMYVLSVIDKVDPWAFMGVLQSKMFLFLYRTSNQGESRVIPQIKATKLLPLPFPDISKQVDVWKMVSEAVRNLFILTKKAAASQTDHGKTSSDRQAATLDRQIDQMVYRLYQLDAADIEMVEAG